MQAPNPFHSRDTASKPKAHRRGKEWHPSGATPLLRVGPETLCSLFSIDGRFPKLNVAGSILVPVLTPLAMNYSGTAGPSTNKLRLRPFSSAPWGSAPRTLSPKAPSRPTPAMVSTKRSAIW